MKEPHKINFRPNRVQRGFIESRATADLFSSRMGEGKSTALSWSSYYYTHHNPGARGMIVRDTWTNLEKTTLESFFQWFPPGIAGTFKRDNKTFTWANGLAQGNVTFIGMDDPKDASKLMSRDVGYILIDEAAPAVGSSGIDELVFDLALSRVRQSDMKWHSVKLAENNPDEDHWTYKRFVSPGVEGFRLWQPGVPENIQNLPPGYYEKLRAVWGHRPDLIRRFIDGEFGFQQEGLAVTPQWDDRRHLVVGLQPDRSLEVIILWDFGHNPTATFTQKTRMGHWLILDCLVGEGIGVEELISDEVKPLLQMRYKGLPLRHIGDPAGKSREQTSIHRSPVRFIKKELGGTWINGPVRFEDGAEPLRSALHRGVVKVDRERAKPIWYALRGGWHFHIARSGVPAMEPKKNIHSHPGDTMRYGAGVLFPLGTLSKRSASGGQGAQPKWFTSPDAPSVVQIGKPGLTIPRDGASLDPRTIRTQGS
jgi:hypothetical protein